MPIYTPISLHKDWSQDPLHPRESSSVLLQALQTYRYCPIYGLILSQACCSFCINPDFQMWEPLANWGHQDYYTQRRTVSKQFSSSTVYSKLVHMQDFTDNLGDQRYFSFGLFERLTNSGRQMFVYRSSTDSIVYCIGWLSLFQYLVVLSGYLSSSLQTSCLWVTSVPYGVISRKLHSTETRNYCPYLL